VPLAVAPSIEAAQHCCRQACVGGGDDFLVALLVTRRGESPMIVYGTGMTSRADSATRKAIKFAAKLLFSSLPVIQHPPPPAPRNPISGLLWSVVPDASSNRPPAANGASSTVGTVAGAVTSAASALGAFGGGRAASAVASAVTGRHAATADTSETRTGGGVPAGAAGGSATAGGGAGLPSARDGQVATTAPAAPAAPAASAAPTAPAPSAGVPLGGGGGHMFAASIEGTDAYPALPELPLWVGTASTVKAPVTGKRSREDAEKDAAPASPVGDADVREKADFTVTAPVLKELKDKMADANMRFTRKHMSDFAALVKFCYDDRLQRPGVTAPYEPLLPKVAENKTMDVKVVDALLTKPIPFTFKNAGQQSKYATLGLILYMTKVHNDRAYQWVLDRYMAGMRVGRAGPTAGKPRRPRAKKASAPSLAAAGAPVAGAQGGNDGGGAAGDDGAGASGGSGVGAGAGGGAAAGTFLAPLRRATSQQAAAVERGRLARYCPATAPVVLPPIAEELFIRGVKVGSGRVHPELEKQHGTLLPRHKVSAFFLSCNESAGTALYPHGGDPSFCLEAGYPQEVELRMCVSQRVVWDVCDIGYVGLCPSGVLSLSPRLLWSCLSSQLSTHSIVVCIDFVLFFSACVSACFCSTWCPCPSTAYRPRVNLWSGLPGPSEKILGTTLVWRVAPRRDTEQAQDEGRSSAHVAVEVYDGSFSFEVATEDYEASDLLYRSDMYNSYAGEHFGGIGVPSTLGRLDDMRSWSTSTLRFLWCAAFTTRVT